jgi:TonB-dependent receptor
MNYMGTQQPQYSSLQTPYVYSSVLSDHDYDAKADWKVPFKLSDNISGILSAGGKYHSVDRTNNYVQRSLAIQFGSVQGTRVRLAAFAASMFPGFYTDVTNPHGLDAHNFTDPNYTSGQVLGYAIGPQYNIYKLLALQNAWYVGHSDVYYINAANDYSQDYTDKENSAAGYIMGEFNIGSKLTVVPGVRFQEEKTDIQSYHILYSSTAGNGLASPVATVEFKRDNPNWYPSINIKYKATDNIQIIGAAYRSVSLPSFIDISPMVIFNPGANPQITSGNPFLKPSTATNLDLGVSFSNNNIGLFTVNVFYKEISNLIYQLNNYQPFNKNILPGYPADLFNRLPATSSNYFDTAFAKQLNGVLSTNIPVNDPYKAYLRGIEFSWQTHLWYLPWVLNGIVLDLNVSFMSSAQTYPYFDTKRVGTGLSAKDYLYYQTRAGQLQDQPKATYNAILGWDYKGFSSRFSFRYQEVTLTNLDTQYPMRDAYYDNVLLVDISVKQNIIYNLSIFANVTNINSHIDNYYLSYYNGKDGSSGRLPTSQQTYGMQAQLGVSFNY